MATNGKARRKTKRARGFLGTDDLLLWIAEQSGVVLDEGQWQAVAQRRGISSTRAVATIEKDGKTYRESVSSWCLADIRRHLRWMQTCDPRQLDSVREPNELPTPEEIAHRCELMRGLRGLANKADEEERERVAWEAPQYRLVRQSGILMFD